MRRNLSLLTLVLTLACCGYSVKALLPGHLKTISVQPVENMSSKPNLAVPLTDLLVNRFQSDGSLRIVDLGHADVVLNCQVTNYAKSPQTYNASQEVSTWRIDLEAKADAQDKVKTTEIWAGTVSVSVTYDGTSETEDQGILKALDKLASDIVRRTLIAW